MLDLLLRLFKNLTSRIKIHGAFFLGLTPILGLCFVQWAPISKKYSSQKSPSLKFDILIFKIQIFSFKNCWIEFIVLPCVILQDKSFEILVFLVSFCLSNSGCVYICQFLTQFRPDSTKLNELVILHVLLCINFLFLQARLVLLNRSDGRAVNGETGKNRCKSDH